MAAWTVLQERDQLLGRLPQFDDPFDQVILMCGAPAADGSLPEEWPARERGKTLSLCAYPTNTARRRETGVGFIDPHSLAPHVDYYRALAYDLLCPPSEFVGPTFTAPWGRECMTYLARMVPRHKLVMGPPTYSVDWDIADPTRSRQVNDAAFIAAREKESAIGRGCC